MLQNHRTKRATEGYRRHPSNSSKLDAIYRIAEQGEAKDLIERLNWLSDQILQDAPQPSLQFAAELRHFITQEANNHAVFKGAFCKVISRSGRKSV